MDRLGPDPLSPDFGPATLQLLVKSRSGSQRRTRAVHTLLLDQSLVSGIGNIYSAEALFRAGVRPQRPAGNMTRLELER
ncbi:MAG: DNA-formamidopyrimidine glycosylase, partial [Chloroflexi bacterium]|nr:DNA-formamidopyrimidine glycosylase [Chloroflexota bacterium]